jgi:hypothetical protein
MVPGLSFIVGPALDPLPALLRESVLWNTTGLLLASTLGVASISVLETLSGKDIG